MALVEVDFSYKIKEWGTTTFELDDVDIDQIEGLTRNYILEKLFDLEDEVTNIEIENVRTKELIG